ncbi:hypothetical protein [Microlunatus parietis]|uniref:Uncharacterized protein n=1 Tax=Microlunatus parietis TaxID=682979 RepID=A0A7Y9IE01_9ACTN|nr:hypothetical protein [Microlunatus parietis]NYE75025.1 hypothetical protein [Microlunatus parietis]
MADSVSPLRLARPYLITAAVFLGLGVAGFLLGQALQINYLSTLLALGGAGLVLVGTLFLLSGTVVLLIATLRSRSG